MLLISLFLGSYFAARVSQFQSRRIGSAQGLIIASLFMGFFVYQAGQTIGDVGSLAGSFIGGSVNLAGKGVQKASESEHVRDTFNSVVQNTIGDLNLKSEIQTVAINVGNRLYRGDEEGAIDYLSQESGISREEARSKLSELRLQAEETVGDAKNMAGSALKATGWTLFLLVLMGTISSTLGGALGSKVYIRSE